MASADGGLVFISYARKDGAELANRLLGDLKREGFEVWLDTHEIAGGTTWTKEIEEALDGADVVLALLTSGLTPHNPTHAGHSRRWPYASFTRGLTPLCDEPIDLRGGNSHAHYATQ
jgi:hypothetical protein